jgi:HTH-type transcriptional regulator / antitoxin HipB
MRVSSSSACASPSPTRPRYTLCEQVSDRLLLPVSGIADMFVRTPRELGAALRDRRKSLGLEQKTLAEKVGVSRQWIIAVEAGKDRADLALVLRTLDALGLRVDVTADEAQKNERDSDAGAFLTVAALSSPDIDAVVDAARRPPDPVTTKAPGKPARKKRR